MGEERKKAKASGVGGGELAAQAALTKDPKSAKLLAAGRALGNDEMKRRIDGKNANRDEMLSYLCDRLKVMREAQLRELDLGQVDKRRVTKSIRREADPHKDAFSKPDPKRWAEPAGIYEEAARQLCRGALSQGAQLVERAIAAEKKVFDETSSAVDLGDLEREQEAPAGTSDLADGSATCAPCDMPEGVEVAAEIERVNTEFRDVTNRRRIRDPYWTEEDEEEEEEDADGG